MELSPEWKKSSPPFIIFGRFIGESFHSTQRKLWGSAARSFSKINPCGAKRRLVRNREGTLSAPNYAEPTEGIYPRESVSRGGSEGICRYNNVRTENDAI